MYKIKKKKAVEKSELLYNFHIKKIKKKFLNKSS